MHFTTLALTALLTGYATTAPIDPASTALIARQSSNPLTGLLSGLLTGGQQSDSDGEGNAVSTSECGLIACTSGAAASAESGNSTSSSSASSSSSIGFGKWFRFLQL